MPQFNIDTHIQPIWFSELISYDQNSCGLNSDSLKVANVQKLMEKLLLCHHSRKYAIKVENMSSKGKISNIQVQRVNMSLIQLDGLTNDLSGHFQNLTAKSKLKF